MINLKKTLLTGLVALSASTVMAGQPGFYLGAGGGWTHAADACERVDAFGITPTHCDDTDNSWDVFGGYQIGNNFAIEAGYTDLGSYGGNVASGTAIGSYDATSTDLSVLGILPLGDMFSVYARGGYGLVDANTEVKAFGGKATDGGTEGAWLWGAGVGASVADHVDVRLDWRHYKDIDNNSVAKLGTIVGHVDLDVYSIEAVYHFGSKPAPAAAPAEQVSLNIQVLFDTAKSNIKSEYAGEIQKAVDFLTAHPEAKAVIEGHTDSVGTDAYNQALSERRANSVMSAIAAKGIDASRLSAVGYGESKPVADNATAEGRSQNRRVVAEFEGVSIKSEM